MKNTKNHNVTRNKNNKTKLPPSADGDANNTQPKHNKIILTQD